MTKKIKVALWDAAKFLNTEESRLAFLEAAAEDGDAEFLEKCRATVERSRQLHAGRDCD